MVWHISSQYSTLFRQFVGNKAKGRISKRVVQEKKARQIFRKTNISTCFFFSENLPCFFSWKTPFEIRPFALFTDEFSTFWNVRCSTVLESFEVNGTFEMGWRIGRIWDALHDLVPSVQFKKREKHCNFSLNNTALWVFSRFFRFYKWYQIVQSVTYVITSLLCVIKSCKALHHQRFLGIIGMEQWRKNGFNNSANIYLLKVDNRDITRFAIHWKLAIKTPERGHWHRSGFFIVNFEHISHLFLVFLWLTLNK